MLAARQQRSLRSDHAHHGGAFRPPIQRRPAPLASLIFSRTRPSSISLAARPIPTPCLGSCCSLRRSGTLPELDHERRPKFAYDRDIHEHCPRRAHFDAGRFVKQFGDEGHREGWCLYEMGCKGPDTHAGCSTRHFNEIPDVWPIGIGAPCIGCTEKSIAFRVPMFQVVQIHTTAEPPTTYAPIIAPQGKVSPIASGIGRTRGGALAGAGYVASRKFSNVPDDESVPGSADSGKHEAVPAKAQRASDESSRRGTVMTAQISRRQALLGLVGLGGTVAGAATAVAEEHPAHPVAAPDAVGMLYDNTICTGCKACMPACNEANGLPPDTLISGGLWDMPPISTPRLRT